jgi:hypothetical protein
MFLAQSNQEGVSHFSLENAFCSFRVLMRGFHELLRKKPEDGGSKVPQNNSILP